MADSMLRKIERDLEEIGEQLWGIDDPDDDALDKVCKKLSSLKAQASVQKSLQATANLLRRQPADKALPKQQATKVKHLIRFVFGKQSRRGARHKRLRAFDCDALKLVGLSYSTEEIVKMPDAEFEVLQDRGSEFFCRRKLSRLLYRPDIDTAVSATVKDLDDDGAYDKFIQDHTAIQLQTRKRKYDDRESGDVQDSQVAMCDKAGPTQGEVASSLLDGREVTEKLSTKEKMRRYGDGYIVSKGNAYWALSIDSDVGEIWLTIPENDYESYDGKNRAFLTLWITIELGRELAGRSTLMARASDKKQSI